MLVPKKLCVRLNELSFLGTSNAPYATKVEVPTIGHQTHHKGPPSAGVTRALPLLGSMREHRVCICQASAADTNLWYQFRTEAKLREANATRGPDPANTKVNVSNAP